MRYAHSLRLFNDSSLNIIKIAMIQAVTARCVLQRALRKLESIARFARRQKRISQDLNNEDHHK
jgi:hypothetical protein